MSCGFGRTVKHLRVPVPTRAEVLQSDALRIERHFRSWTRGVGSSVAIVRYEELWSSVDQLSEFVGFQGKSPDASSDPGRYPG